MLCILKGRVSSDLDSLVAVLGGEDEPGQVGRQVQAAEIPHQVPEDDGVLAEELVGVDHLGGGDGGGFSLSGCSVNISAVSAGW